MWNLQTVWNSKNVFFEHFCLELAWISRCGSVQEELFIPIKFLVVLLIFPLFEKKLPFLSNICLMILASKPLGTFYVWRNENLVLVSGWTDKSNLSLTDRNMSRKFRVMTKLGKASNTDQSCRDWPFWYDLFKNLIAGVVCYKVNDFEWMVP